MWCRRAARRPEPLRVLPLRCGLLWRNGDLGQFGSSKAEAPENRTEKGWQNILESARLSLEPKLDKLDRIEDVFALAEKCLSKNQSILEDFRFIATENVCREAVEWSAQVNFVHAAEEGKTFERDLEISSRLDKAKNSRSCVFEHSLEHRSEPLNLIETSEPIPRGSC